MTVYLAASGIIKLHEWLIKSVNGDAEILHRCMVDSIAERPRTTITTSLGENGQPIDPQEIYSDILSKAIALSYPLIMWHAFLDGNKRTAILSLGVMFEVNDVHFHWPIYLTKYSVQAATEEIDEAQFKELIRPLTTTNWFAHIWKVVRYEILPSSFLNLLTFTRIAPKYTHKLALDWYAAGHEEIFQKLFNEKVTFNKNLHLNLQDDDFVEQ
ncbi:MAG: type II toxin-antitoxin system death-on-curing family toxin [Nitrososphaerales archaeon]